MFRRIALATLLAATAAACTARYVRDTKPEAFEATPARVDRGRYLVNHVAACGACHTSRPNGDMLQPEGTYLAGGNWLQDGKLGAWIPNLTHDAETGLGAWTDEEILRAIRDGIGRDGDRLLPVMPAYRALSDEDARAIVVYLRTVPAAKPATPRRDNDVPFMMNLALSLGAGSEDPVESVPEPDRADPVAYGAYLSDMAQCHACHARAKMGVRDADDEYAGGATAPARIQGIGRVWAGNLTPHATGIGNRTDDELALAIRSGLRADGKLMAPPMSWYVPHLALLEETDLRAMIAFLRALPPVERQVPARELDAEAAALYGG